ncbi:MAG: SRPBCC family protein [Pseudomonadota bacterium]|nr:SRPBCC family protein [Pseudomonadota bacterium]
MRHDDQVAMIRELFAHIENGTQTYADSIHRNPISNYTSRERLEREREVLFRKTPIMLGLAARIREPGEYMVEDVAGREIIAVRGKDGQVRAFQNVCRHRGAPLAQGCGKTRRFTCPYHAWTYGLDGKLQVVPDSPSFEGLDKDTHGLVEVPAAERYGLLFVQAGGGEMDIDAHLAGIGRDMEPYGFENFHHYRSLTIRRAMNWKLSPETFMEGYHLQYLHSGTVGPIFFSNLMVCHTFGPHCRLVIPRRRVLELKGRPETEWNLVPETAMVYTFFPNVTFVVQAGHIEMWRAYPDGPDPARCRVEVSVFTPQKVENEKAQAYYEKNIDLAIRTVDGEDFPLSERIQAGHAAHAQDAVTYGRNEAGLIHYVRTLDAALAAA